ncbi:MAG: sensor histidine kinase [Kineothrix sp.]
MIVINYNTIIAEADNTLTLLSQNRGAFPDFNKNNMPKHMTPETPYESRYFSVLLTADGKVIQVDTKRIKSIDAQTAIEYASLAVAADKTHGFIHQYRFQSYSEHGLVRIVFLDCQKRLDVFQNFLMISSGMALGGYIAFFFAILFFSGKITRPVTESYEKQKRFITDAGHEIKTPLAIIRADTEVLEMDLGESEWSSDIKKQTKRLELLTNDLIFLSRLEEAGNSLQMVRLPFSDIVAQEAASFTSLMKTQNRIFQCDIQPMVSLTGDEKSIRQLVNILMDNALKYSPPHGLISLSVKKQGKQIRLALYNTTEKPIPKDRLAILFDRFYRVDSSRNTQTGGFGIGLSIAKAIVTAHKGRIQALAKEERSLEIVVLFPSSQ